jgi:hypothetical protein
MKKIYLLFHTFFLSVIVLGQVSNSEKTVSLNQEIYKIKNSTTFLQFLMNHAATFDDFDALYSIIEDKPCPEKFTYNLVNGDSSSFSKVNRAFLYLIVKNLANLSFNTGQLKINSYNDIVLIKPIKDPYSNFFDTYNFISNEIKNKINIRMDSFSSQQIYIYNDTSQYLNVKNNINCWINQLTFSREAIEKSFYVASLNDEKIKNLKIINQLEVLFVSENRTEENGFWYQINRQDEDFLKNDFGGSESAKKISRYISGSVFQDGIFIKLKEKYIWFDFGDWF